MFDADLCAVSKSNANICPRFDNDAAWNGDISRFDTSSVTDMSYMYVLSLIHISEPTRPY